MERVEPPRKLKLEIMRKSKSTQKIVDLGELLVFKVEEEHSNESGRENLATKITHAFKVSVDEYYNIWQIVFNNIQGDNNEWTESTL